MNAGQANPVNGAVNAFKNVAKNTSTAVAAATNAAATTMSNAAAQVVNATNKAINQATSTVATAMNNAAKQAAPAINSLIPFGNQGNQGNKKNNGGNAGNGGNGGNKGNGGNVGNGANFANKGNAASPPPTGANFSVAPMVASWAWPLGIFILLVAIFVVIFAVFADQIRSGYETVANALKRALGIQTEPDVLGSINPLSPGDTPVTLDPKAPQELTPQDKEVQQGAVEKLLPTGAGNEVFNVSQNKFTFYDAEPLCRALGAELATYEQVKDAWSKGADWCNYGWVKGQMAIYPTQKGTYDKLQAGPEDQRNVCGTPGVNGGFFDNPELRYGVNCYGKKPTQSAHDEAMLMSEGKIPRSPDTLKVDELTNTFKTQRDSLFVMPFSDDKWASS